MYKEKILFLGIGGVSTSLLALYAKHRGATIIGYDAKESETTRRLEKEGVKIYYKPRPYFTDYDYAVYSSAIKSDNPEMIKTKALNKPCIERRDFLGFVASMHRKVIAISGAHGKTTTTALISHVLLEAGFDVTSHIGGESLGRTGIGDDVFVAEACEYKGSFLSLQPDIALILNMERDHPDCYPTDESYRLAFEAFAKGIKPGGSLIIGKREYEKLNGVAGSVVFPVLGNGIGDYNENVDFVYKDVKVTSPLKGKYNAENIAFAIETAKLFDIDADVISKAISTFKGVKRRFERIGTVNNVPIISDYAHHPTELRKTIEVAKTYGKVFAIFQPHTYSRTACFFDDFVKVLKECDESAIYKTFSAREIPEDGIDAKTLSEKIGSQYLENDSELYELLNRFKGKPQGDVLLILGAGDLDEKVRRYFQS